MKIGIITFHYVTNYGAVLQAYALQQYLTKMGHQAVIIDYFPLSRQKPLNKRLLARRPRAMLAKLIEFRKEASISRFRERNLCLTARYHSLTELQASPPQCDAYICGSDQIWNPHFTAQGENKKPTLSYFLDFGDDAVMRISYAASFGCTSYSDYLMEFVKPALSRFGDLSVREETGRNILHSIGFKNVDVVPDPTLLLDKEDYAGLCAKNRRQNANAVFIYALHLNQNFMTAISSELKRTYRTLICDTNSYWAPGIEDWLMAISSAKCVVTNSFHGVVFSILFNKNFVAIPVEGPNAGMNDRLHTLLGQLGLIDRILPALASNKLHPTLAKPINWEAVNTRLQKLRIKGANFLTNALER